MTGKELLETMRQDRLTDEEIKNALLDGEYLGYLGEDQETVEDAYNILIEKN